METVNREMDLARRFVEDTAVSVFLTGRAGTGKTTFLRRLRRRSSKRIVVVAPTGVAAINAEGVTMHSFFQLSFGAYIPGTPYDPGKYRMSRDKQNLMRTMDLLIIDEISMVRADLLDAVDSCLRFYRDRTRPFGGVQLLMIGDLHQLAPVTQGNEWDQLTRYYASPYFFSSLALRQVQYVTVELRHVYRQQDQQFVDILNAVRENKITPQVREALNARHIPHFAPPAGEHWIHLTTHNRAAQEYNTHCLQELPGQSFTFRARTEGDFPESLYPCDFLITLRQGAQVMFIKNDPSGAFFNGKIGTVTRIDQQHIAVHCEGEEGDIEVPTVTWDNTKYTIDAQTKDIKQEVVGHFHQVPLRLAWAITVHKSQGLTFDHAVLDINQSFAHGQMYVALSRCRTLEGLVLQYPIDLSRLIDDADVDRYMALSLEAAQRAEADLPALCRQYYADTVHEQFDFTRLSQALTYLTRVVDEHLYHLFPDFLQLLKQTLPVFDQHIGLVAGRFAQQLDALLAAAADNYADDPQLKARTQAAARYFATKMTEVVKPVVEKSALSIENKADAKRYERALTDFMMNYMRLTVTLDVCLKDGFSLHTYLSTKAKSMLMEAQTSESPYVRHRRERSPRPVAERGEKKIPTVDVTFGLFTEGKSPKEVAIARGLTLSTIYNHLTKLVEADRLCLDDIVPPARQLELEALYARFDGQEDKHKKICAMLPEGSSYEELRMVVTCRRG